MSGLSETNKEALIEFKEDYESAHDPASADELLLMDQMMTELHAMDTRNPSLESAWAIYQAYAEYTPAQRQFLHDALEDFEDSDLGQAIKQLQAHKLLSGDQAHAHFNAITEHENSLIAAFDLKKHQETLIEEPLTKETLQKTQRAVSDSSDASQPDDPAQPDDPGNVSESPKINK